MARKRHRRRKVVPTRYVWPRYLTIHPDEVDIVDKAEPVPPHLEVRRLPLEDPVVSRLQWGAEPPRKPLPVRNGPASNVVCPYTASDPCETEAECVEAVKSVQKRHMEDMAQIDLPYNFLVGGDGRVYEGRGWNVVAAFPKMYPKKFDDGSTLSIAMVGDEKKMFKPTEHMVHARRNLLRYGRENGFLNKGIHLLTCINGRV